MNDALSLVDGLHHFLLLLVLLSVLLCFLDHVLNLIFAKTAGRLDHNCNYTKFSTGSLYILFFPTWYHSMFLNQCSAINNTQVLALTLLFLASALVPGRDMYNAIGINVKGDFNLWDSTWSRRDADQAELSQKFVITSHLSLSLVNFDLYLCLAVSSCGEYLKHRAHTMSSRILETQSTHYVITPL